MKSYVPLIMRPGWILERYYGWKVFESGPQLKLLCKPRGPLRTWLLLTNGAGQELVDQAAMRHHIVSSPGILTWTDLAPSGGEVVLLGRRLEPVERGRWFGVGTFVFDLDEDLDCHWARMAPRERTKCRKAEGAGVTCVHDRSPEPAALDAFLRLHGRLARRRGLERIERALLERMFADGALLLTRCLDTAGHTLVANLTYLQDGDGYFLLGSRSAEIPPGSGQLAHWATLGHLKAAGANHYDLGLVASCDETDGIYCFKRALGGRFVALGREYRWVPQGLATAYRAFRVARGWLRMAS